MLKIHRERSERRKQLRNISVLDIKKIIGPRPLGGGGAPGAPPPLNPLVLVTTLFNFFSIFNETIPVTKIFSLFKCVNS